MPRRSLNNKYHWIPLPDPFSCFPPPNGIRGHKTPSSTQQATRTNGKCAQAHLSKSSCRAGKLECGRLNHARDRGWSSRTVPSSREMPRMGKQKDRKLWRWSVKVPFSILELLVLQGLQRTCHPHIGGRSTVGRDGQTVGLGRFGSIINPVRWTVGATVILTEPCQMWLSVKRLMFAVGERAR